MNEVIFMLAILVNKKVLSLQEAVNIKKSLSQGIISSNLKDMVNKVDEAMQIIETDFEKIHAEDIL